ncbi:MAG TPA: error-prone DNA polymerase [Gemmatimonadaceae bacterium]|nr:error-prone DNA polymerase [Gemmatimonadaceae bacterium]
MPNATRPTPHQERPAGEGTSPPAPRPLPPAPYVELRSHTAFSFGSGAVAPETLVRHAKALGYDALAVTDAADLGAAVRFAVAAVSTARDRHCLRAEDHGPAPCPACERALRPIVGAELDVDGRPAAFLARTAEGFRNLAALVTRARVGGWDAWAQDAQAKRRGRPRLTWAQVAERSAGLHALTGPASGELAALLRAGDEARARRALGRWREAFGDRLAVEVQLHHAGGAEGALAAALVALAEGDGVPWVVAHDAHYVDEGGRLVHDLLTALRHETTVDDAAARGLLHPNGEWRLLSPSQMTARWRGRETGVRESVRIAAECDFDLAWLRPPLPGFPVPEGHDEHTFLRAVTYEGAFERWGTALTPKHTVRLDHELDVIRALGFDGFFLVMWDAVRWARERGILCQGRGSAANSAVAYCLGVTAVDPVRHGLLFERFLSEVRVDGKAEAPDIDVDVEHDRREELLDYIYGRYRRSHSAITCTVQHYRAPNAVLDAMRALGYPAETAFKVSKRVRGLEPAEGAAHVRDVLAPELGLDLSDARGRALLAAVAAFEGLPRMRATHVGGFVLSAAPLGDHLPIEQTTMGRTIVQFDKDDLDSVGVPKFDFLGLGALSLVRRAFDVIERRSGRRPHVYALPPDDPAAYALVARGETVGMFQIESRAQIASIVHTRPERLYDLVVQVALIRPGPIQARFVHPYTRRRRGEEPVTYPHPRLRRILERTQGIPIFQEQAMAIAMALAGYTGGEAYELRRAMGNERKRDRLMAALERLEARMTAQGVDAAVAARVCEDLESFANYGFPESHAWSFALIAYATAWLKAHHAAAFYAGLLNSQPMGFYPVSTLLHDARRHGVPLRPACLRDGERDCTVEETEDPARPALRVGWRFVRGAGERLLDALAAARAGGPFASIADVVGRAGLTRGDALALARAGSFGAWEADRRRAVCEALRFVGDVLPLAPAHAAEHEQYHPRPLDRGELVVLDYATTGASLHGHPMESARERLRALGVLDSRDLERTRDRQRVVVAGLVTVRQRPQTAKGTIFLLLEDEHGFINVIVPRQLVAPNEAVVKLAPFIMVLGRFEWAGGVLNVVGEKFQALPMGEIVHTSHDFR